MAQKNDVILICIRSVVFKLLGDPLFYACFYSSHNYYPKINKLLFFPKWLLFRPERNFILLNHVDRNGSGFHGVYKSSVHIVFILLYYK